MNQLLVTLIVILLPGIIAANICDQIIARTSTRTSFEFGLSSVVLGVLTYAVLQLCWYAGDMIGQRSWSPGVWTQLQIWNAVVSEQRAVPVSEIVGAALLSVPIAMATAWMLNYKVLNKTARWLKVSYKFGDENLYSYYLNAKEIDWIYVRDRPNNLTYQGRVVSYSENDKIQELVLSDVTVFSYTDSQELYSVPTMYRSRPAGQFTIEAIPPNLLGVPNAQETAN